MDLKPKNIQFKQRVARHLERQNFMHHLDFRLATIEAGYTAGELVVRSIHHQQDGFVHGGVVATLADIVAGFAAYTLVAADQSVVTGEIKISYFRRGEGDILRAEGRVIKPGKRLNFCEAEVFAVTNGRKTLIAKASTTMITI